MIVVGCGPSGTDQTSEAERQQGQKRNAENTSTSASAKDSDTTQDGTTAKKNSQRPRLVYYKMPM